MAGYEVLGDQYIQFTSLGHGWFAYFDGLTMARPLYGGFETILFVPIYVPILAETTALWYQAPIKLRPEPCKHSAIRYATKQSTR